MSLATKNNVGSKALAKPVVCKRCKSTHFNYTLTCKRCGEYLNKLDMVSENGMPVGKLFAFAGLTIALVGACFALHLF